MLVSETLICFHAIRRFPGLTIDELAAKIHEYYGSFDAAKNLTFGEDYWLMLDRISLLDCVEDRGGRYYYNHETIPRSRDQIINACVEMQLAKEKDQYKRRPQGD